VTTFVDTSALFAAANASDRHHARAKEILAAGDRLLTTDHVVVECWFLVRSRSNHDAAERLWNSLHHGPVVVEQVLAADMDTAWRIGEDFPDQSFSIVDRTSFAVMQRLAIHRAVSFDDHFLIYRFGRTRDRAFEVVR
jgi:predicted nucleic acid-binding protein